MGGPFTQETSNLPIWEFFNWMTSFTIRAFILVLFMGVSYLSTNLACTRFPHILSIWLQLMGHKPRLWQSQLKFFPSGYSLPSIDGLVHPPPSRSTSFKALKSMLGHILFDYRVILHVILHVLNPLVRLQLTHRSRKYKLIFIHPLLGPWVWGEIREIERDAHNTNQSFEKADFICGCREKHQTNDSSQTSHLT